MASRFQIFTILALLSLSVLITPSCETNRGLIIPYVKVYVDLDLYAELGNMGIGTTRIIPDEGYKGIVLYREADLVFHAYDLTCTEYPAHDRAVEEDDNFIGVFECPECAMNEKISRLKERTRTIEKTDQQDLETGSPEKD